MSTNTQSFKDRKLEEKRQVILESMRQDFNKNNMKMGNPSDVKKYLTDENSGREFYGVVTGMGLFMVGMAAYHGFVTKTNLPWLWFVFGIAFTFIGLSSISRIQFKEKECLKMLR